MVTIDSLNLNGRTFLKDSDEVGQRFRAGVVRADIDKEDEMKKRSEYMKFICEVPNSTVDEILSSNEILDIDGEENEAQNDTEQLFKFRRITAHQGPFEYI
jgi:hypothetical protein